MNGASTNPCSLMPEPHELSLLMLWESTQDKRLQLPRSLPSRTPPHGHKPQRLGQSPRCTPPTLDSHRHALYSRTHTTKYDSRTHCVYGQDGRRCMRHSCINVSTLPISATSHIWPHLSAYRSKLHFRSNPQQLEVSTRWRCTL